MRTQISFGVLAAVVFAFAAPAQAQRVFVSATGLDGNPCTFASPCRSFQHAHDVAAANGEIDVLDPAGYGALTISKAISIQGHGYAGISAASGDAIDINAGASDKISLRGLLIDGVGSGNNGILFNTGQALTVDGCVIRHFSNFGIELQPSASTNFLVSNTLVADNSASGMYVLPSGSGTVTAEFDHVQVSNNQDGIWVQGTSSSGFINITASESVASGNVGYGFFVFSSSGHASTTLTVIQSVSANNGTGLSADFIGVLRVGHSTVTGNSAGWLAQNGGTVQSYANNYIDGNNSSNTAPPSIATK